MVWEIEPNTFLTMLQAGPNINNKCNVTDYKLNSVSRGIVVSYLNNTKLVSFRPNSLWV